MIACAAAKTTINGKRLYIQTNTNESTPSHLSLRSRIRYEPTPNSTIDSAGARVIDIRYKKGCELKTSGASQSHL